MFPMPFMSARRSLKRTVRFALAAFGALSRLTASASGQEPEQAVPRFDIGTPEELRIALGVADQWGDAFPRAAIVALEGRRVLPWLLDILRDETVEQPTRWAALRVLQYTRDREAVPDLLRLASSSESIREQARSALSHFPYPEVCDYWRRLLRAGGTSGSDVVHGLQGLGWCGDQQDLSLAELFLTSTRQPYRFAAQVAIERIRAGESRYYTAYMRGPPRPDGRYVPSDSVAAQIRRALCDGPCASVLIPVSQPLRQDRER